MWYYGKFETDEANGMVRIASGMLAPGYLYALVELDPLNGYLPQEKPYLFYMEFQSPSATVTADIVADGGLVVIKNYPVTYALPKTGALGSHWFTLSGLALSLPVTYQFYRKRRKEDPDSS